MKENLRKKRTLKKNIKKRDHYCGCGKKYKDYSSLWTHQKNKHNKTVPKGSSNENQKKPGRPSQKRK